MASGKANMAPNPPNERRKTVLNTRTTSQLLIRTRVNVAHPVGPRFQVVEIYPPPTTHWMKTIGKFIIEAIRTCLYKSN